jgi:hypothetical protein
MDHCRLSARKIPFLVSRMFKTGRAYPRPLRRVPGKMNKLEAEYADILVTQRVCGEIIDHKFEAVTLKIGPDCRYTPDFLVIKPDCIEFHEVKGFWRDDAKVKIKVAAQSFPMFRFISCEKIKGKWEMKEVEI